MRTWERVRLAEKCGGCGRGLDVGTPIQVIRTEGITKRRVRAECCSDGPADVEALERFDVQEDGKASKPVTVIDAPEFLGVTRCLFDAKVAQTGERE